MNINLANIDFCPGGKSATLTETTAEILLSETEKVIMPPEGTDGFNKVTITHAPVEESVSATITENGTHTITPSAGFGAMFGVNVDVNVPSKTEVAKDIVITENGNTTYTPNEGEVFNSVSVDVNIPSVTDDKIQYFNRKPTADDAGLKAIGWTDESVNYFKYNNYAYPWEADNLKVSDANKQIVINNKSDIATYKDNPDFKYCPMFDTSKVTGMNEMFSGCKFLNTIPQLDTHSVTNMSFMFENCNSLTSIPLLDTGKATDMSFMFYKCTLLTTIPLLNTSNVTSMNYMFSECSSLTTIPLLDTSKATDMREMFRLSNSLTTIPLLNTSNVTDMTEMFNGCSALTSIPQLDTSKVEYMTSMFYDCKSLITIPLLNTSKVTDMRSMFSGCISLTTIPQLDTHSVTNMNSMFSNCKSLITIPKLDATSLTNAGNMFGSSWSGLKNLTTFGGLTNLKVDLTLSYCPTLTKESLLNVFNEAADVTASPKTLTLGETNLAKLTDADKAIATNKGWTLK